MIQLLQSIVNSFSTLIQFVINSIQSFITLISFIPQFITFLTSGLAFLPSVLMPFCLISISVYVLFLILGRN